jgi:hypothetical protein
VCKDSFSENSVWSEEERWSFEKQQETLSALQKETVARAFVMALLFTKGRPYTLHCWIVESVNTGVGGGERSDGKRTIYPNAKS